MMDDKGLFESLRKKLEEQFEWPTIYLFKFIVPADNKKIAEVESLFDAKEAQINLRTSKKGNFVSVSAKELMVSPESVIQRYKDAARIEGVISL